MQYSASSNMGLAPSTFTVGAQNAARERDPNCIEMHLKNIEAELAESVNSAENLADKLSYSEPKPTQGTANTPAPSNVQSRLEQIVNTVRCLNQQLSRAHSAISG